MQPVKLKMYKCKFSHHCKEETYHFKFTFIQLVYYQLNMTALYSRKFIPFKDKASYDNWKSLFTSLRARRYEHSLPTVTLLGNYIFSRDITDFRREKFPIEDSRWMYINNKADVYIWSTTFKCKAKFWRSPTEIFNTPEAVIAFPRVQKKTDDKFSVIPVPADPHETG